MNQRGFTLIELLVSLTIFAVVALAVYSAFAGGIRAWRSTQDFSATYQTARLVLDDMARELANAVSISGTNFEGETQRLSFLTVAGGPYAQDRPADPKLMRVTYEVQRDRASATNALVRTAAPHGDGSQAEEPEPVVSAISGLEFFYTHKDDKGQIAPWRNAWQVSEAIPLGVKITFKVGETRFTKLVFIPHGFQEPAAK